MTNNPILNALAALVYIIVVSSVLYLGTVMKVGANALIAPVALVSLFTLSAAVMGYVFLYTPAQLYFENKKKQAVNLFLRTVGVFGLITVVIFILLFTGAFNK